MVNSKKAFRNLLIGAMAGLSLVVMPATARADFIVFEVNESSVPGTTGEFDPVSADDLNGRYTEQLILNPGTGAFTTVAFANFGQYFLGSTLVNTELNDTYGLYATFESTGTFTPPTSVSPPLAPGTTLTTFSGLTGEASLYIDPNQDTGLAIVGGDVTRSNTDDDYLIVFANSLLSATGQFFDFTNDALDGGSYVLNFGNVTVTDPEGEAYFPTLANLILTSRLTGDFNNLNNPVSGDVDVQFEAQEVIPEPASLTLLGLGLLGTRFARRRRNAPKV